MNVNTIKVIIPDDGEYIEFRVDPNLVIRGASDDEAAKTVCNQFREAFLKLNCLRGFRK